MRRMVGVVVLLGAIACCGKKANPDRGSTSSESAVKDDGFSRTCATDDDCVVAHFGDTCGICPSSNAAIAKSAQSRWQEAYNAARASCPNKDAVGKSASM